MNFDSFSSQAFERLAQALVVKIFGAGTAVFGRGADGGREASFEGEVPFPSPTDRWAGYIVAQAKCREIPRKNAEDADWLCAQLTADLEKYFTRKRGVRYPEYYLLISNVELSSVAHVGGKAKIEKVFKDFEARLGLKGHAVWSADELRSMLEDAQEIRRAYSAWLTPSDVLSDLIDRLERPNLTKLLPLALMRDLRQERDVRLKDAGQESDTPIYLDSVFIDLPLVQNDGSKRSNATLQLLARSQPVRRNAIGSILRRAANKLDPVSIRETTVKDSPLPNRVVILGGPGQGKSTLSQFVVQVQRARILQARDPMNLNLQMSDIIQPILARAAAEDLWVAGPARFPVRINLPDFADAIANRQADGSVSLLSFMARRLSRDIDVQVSADDLRVWLGTCPSLIVLDGLDEVPPSANRESVIDAIDALWDDLYHVSADTLVVVTTRPQGYNDDLDPKYWSHWELAPLSLEDAKSFAERMAEVRLSDIENRTQVVRQIEVAASDDATKALVTTPLQVAIMFGIILLKGAVPKDRWDLFERYYSLLRDREAQKPASIVRQYKREIDVLHQEIGFLLHMQAEEVGKSVAYFTPEEFQLVIMRLLKREDYSDAEAATIAGELQITATHRLVFLASRITNQIAFDVRSLQEFMAAAQITSASKANLVERLRAISTSSHWRNVFRIAASKIFSVAELGHYRSDILAICHAIDNGDMGEEFRLTRAGAVLALELLSDGVALTAPKFRKGLFRRATAILDTAPDIFSRVLISQVPENLEIADEEIRARLRQSSSISSGTAFRFLFATLEVAPAWAEPIILEYWPKNSAEALKSFSGINVQHCTAKIKAKLLSDQWDAGPAVARAFISSILKHDGVLVGSSERNDFLQISALPIGYFPALERSQSSEQISVEIVRSASGGHGLSSPITSITGQTVFSFHEAECPNAKWETLFAVDDFLLEPTKETLAKIFTTLASDSSCRDLLRSLPWIVATLGEVALEGIGYDALASSIRSGDLGDIEDWLGAEERWSSEGVNVDDIVATREPYFLSRRISEIGSPYFSRISMAHVELDQLQFREFANTIGKVRQPVRRQRLLDVAIFSLNNEKNRESIDFGEIVDIAVRLVPDLPSQQQAELIGWLISANLAPYGDATFYSLLKMAFRDLSFENLNVGLNHAYDGEMELHALVDAFNLSLSHRELLIILAKFADDERIDFDGVNDSAFELKRDDSQAISIAVALIKIASGRWTPSDIRWMVDALCKPAIGLDHVITILGAEPGHPQLMQLLRALTAHAIFRELRHQRLLVEQLRRSADKQKSGLCHLDKRRDLDLPLPPMN